MSFEKGQNINSSALEPEKKKHRIVIASVDIEQQARDIAEEKMLSSKAELKGFRGFFSKIWKHNLAHEYYRQKEISQARREIKESGNLYAGEKGEKEDHENAMNAIVQRFQAEYEGENLLRTGEEKKTLKNGDPSTPRLKNEISGLIKRFASGNLTEEQFQIEKKNIYGEHAPDAKNASVFADNLLEIAKQIKDSIAHGKGLDALDEEYEIVVGKARAGVETEAQYNAVDRITEKIQKSFIGKFINEATVASAVAIAYGTIAKGAVNVAHRGAKLVGPLGMGLSAGIGGAVAGVRENKRIKEERAQHGREMAKGKQIESGSKSREEMEKFRYETKNANELSGNLKEALEGLKTQPSEQKLHAVLEHLNEINSRITFSEQEKIDLVSFSDSKDVEKERTNMYVAVAEAKVYLKKNIHADWATFYNDEQQLNEYLQHVKEAKIQKDFLGEKTLKDEAFNKMKSKKVAWAVTKGLGIGLGVGMVAQEIGASFGNGKEGVFSGANTNGQDHHYTALGYLRRYMSGDLPQGEISQNLQNNILPAGLPVHEISSHESIVTTKDFVKEHENMFSKIHRGAWVDNNTSKPDGNELKLWWGGNEGSGIDKNGNYVFNIKHMTHGGSFHDGKQWNPQELMKAGKMKLLLSLSGDTQNHVIEVPIDANGNAIIDPNSEIGKMAFASADGHAKFLGKFAEVAVMGENVDGAQHVNVLATHLGKGIDSLKTLVTDEHEKIIPHVSVSGENINPVGYDVEAPFVIPIAGRRPMEQLKNGERIKEQIVPPSEGEEEKTEEKKEENDSAAEAAAILAVLAVAEATRKAKEEQEKQEQKQTEKIIQDWETEFEPKKQEEILDSEYIEVEKPQATQQDSLSQQEKEEQERLKKEVLEEQERIAKEKQELLRKILEAKIAQAETEKLNKEQEEKNVKEKERQEKMANSLKNMSKLFLDFELSYDAIEKETEKINIDPFELAMRFVRINPKLRLQYETKLSAIPGNERNEKTMGKLALMIILEYEWQKVKEKIEEMTQEIKQMESEIEIETDLQKKHLLEENKKDIENEIYRLNNKSDDLGTEILRFSIWKPNQGQSSNGLPAPATPSAGRPSQTPKTPIKSPTMPPNIPPVMPANKPPAQPQISERFENELQIKYPGVFENLEKQIKHHKILSRGMKENLFEVFANAKLSDSAIKKLSSAEFVFSLDKNTLFKDGIHSIEIGASGKMEFFFGRDIKDSPNITELTRTLTRTEREL